MNPNNSPVDPRAYLDSIAAQPVKTRFLSGKMLVVAIGAAIVLVLVVVIAIIASSARQGTAGDFQTLAVRLDNLQTILKYGQSNPLRNTVTTKVVAETNVIVASRRSELEKIYTWPEITSVTDCQPSETDCLSPVIAELDEARARGNLDDAYVAALRDQLLAVCSQLEILYGSAKTDAEKAVLSQAYTDFQELADRLPT
ncbi:hypothetical protein FWH58_01530 [Candidatus Saccharibacteria bacterium]|nr:hypothetical protein [Candidatus Saccharibacteria bacterium]